MGLLVTREIAGGGVLLAAFRAGVLCFCVHRNGHFAGTLALGATIAHEERLISVRHRSITLLLQVMFVIIYVYIGIVVVLILHHLAEL